jgi:hypothetical protein
MKIPQALPQFAKDRALLVVSGKQEAHFYRAGEGVITEVASVRVRKPKYTDREGHFETRSKGQVISSGSTYEEKNEKVRKEFLGKFQDELKKTRRAVNPTRIYVFAPEYILPDLTGRFSVRAKAAIRSTFSGNFIRLHPTRLLEKIQDEINATAQRQGLRKSTTESRKLLRRTRRR